MREQLTSRIESQSRSERIRGTLRDDVSPAEAAEWVTRAILSFSVLPDEARSAGALRKYLKKMLIPALIEG
jgi:hypothetical protein